MAEHHLFREPLWLKLTQSKTQKLVSGIAYWLESDWRRLLSERAPDVLTLELQDQIVVYYKFPWWGQQRIHKYLNKQGVEVSRRQVRQAALMRGWSKLCQELEKRFVISAESFRPRDEWFVSQLLQTNEKLVKQLENVNALPLQISVEINALEELAKQNGIQAAPAIRAHAYDVTSATNTFWPMGDG